MALRYPVILNGIRFLINPKHFSVRKPLSMAELPTQEGVEYQTWYNLPEILEIGGQSAGETAFRELQFLKDNFARTNKISELYYKNRLYRGIIREMTITSSSDYIYRFKYSITFQLLQGESFAVEDFALKKTNEDALIPNLKKAWEQIAEDWTDAFEDLKGIVG